MSFVSDVGHLTLGEGVYNNVHGNLNITLNNSYGEKDRPKIDGEYSQSCGKDSLLTCSMDAKTSLESTNKESDDDIEVIRAKHLKLDLEIGSGPGYFLHAGEAKCRAAIVKVFDSGRIGRAQLESTVALSKGLCHPNILRIDGVSSPTADTAHFITYEYAYWKAAEGPLADALEDDSTTSIVLGFKMNFDVLLDINDRFLIGINASAQHATTTPDQQPRDTTAKYWTNFNALCRKVLLSANRVLYDENIVRTPLIPDSEPASATPHKAWASPLLGPQKPEPFSSQTPPGDAASVLGSRREYVWRTMNRGQHVGIGDSSRIFELAYHSI
ncbi:hypothetical protein C8R47DRAFT_1247175 [Mycena vitilis]|nr:hypothetical protein C8R47DRAFT_1247175 [Mycena vitilis]